MIYPKGCKALGTLYKVKVSNSLFLDFQIGINLIDHDIQIHHYRIDLSLIWQYKKLYFDPKNLKNEFFHFLGHFESGRLNDRS